MTDATNPYAALEHAPSPAPPAPQHEMDEMELALALSLAEAGGAVPPHDADTELERALAASLADAAPPPPMSGSGDDDDLRRALAESAAAAGAAAGSSAQHAEEPAWRSAPHEPEPEEEPVWRSMPHVPVAEEPVYRSAAQLQEEEAESLRLAAQLQEEEDARARELQRGAALGGGGDDDDASVQLARKLMLEENAAQRRQQEEAAATEAMLEREAQAQREEARRADEEAARREQAQHVERRARELRRDEEAARKEQERIDADVARQLNAQWNDVARPLAPAAAGPAPGQRRVVVIDGLNVARAQGYREPGFDYEKYRASERGQYPATFARAVKLAIDQLRAKGYHVHAFLPGWALDGGRHGDMYIDKHELLLPYKDAEQPEVFMCPSGREGRAADDQFILKYAMDKQGFVISCDNYRKEISDGIITKEWRDSHCIPYMWVGDDFVVSRLNEFPPMT